MLLTLCEGNPLVTGGLPSQRASNTETDSIWWCHRKSWHTEYILRIMYMVRVLLCFVVVSCRPIFTHILQGYYTGTGHLKIAPVSIKQPWRMWVDISYISTMNWYINGLVQERRNSSALAMELRLSCTNPSISYNHIKAEHNNTVWRKPAECNNVLILIFTMHFGPCITVVFCWKQNLLSTF